MTIARVGLKVKVICQGQMSMSSAYGHGNVVTRSVWPRSSIEHSFTSSEKQMIFRAYWAITAQ